MSRLYGEESKTSQPKEDPAASFEVFDPFTHFAFIHGCRSVNFTNLTVNGAFLLTKTHH